MPVTVNDLPSRPYRGLELLVLGGLALAAVAVVGFTLSMSSGPGGFILAGSIMLGLFVLGALVAIVAPVLLYLDAKKLASYGDDLEWTPNPGLYGALGFFFTGLAVLDYLYKRQKVVIDWEKRSGWWLVALTGIALPIVIGLVASVLGQSSLGFAGVVFAVLLPIGLYKDTGYVRLNAADWQPNPTAHLTYGTVAIFFGPLALLYAGYYLYKRHAHLGTP